MQCRELCDRFDEELRTEAYEDVDASANGLQVGTDQMDVSHVAFAVDAAVATIEDAIDAGADMLVTHHGIIWGGLDRVTGRSYERLAPLLQHDIALYVSHLPLDGHQKLGNAAGVADVLTLDNREPFGTHGGEYIGQRGQLPEPVDVETLGNTLAQSLETGGRDVQILDFGPEQVRDVGIVTGSGVDWLNEAIQCGLDALITGEGKQHVYHEAREAGIHVLFGGHYATETFGVLSLEGLAKQWGLETTYLEWPTGI